MNNMKHFLNIFITAMIGSFAVGIAYVQFYQPKMMWGILYLPWFILAIAWGIKINNDYEN